MTDRLFALDEIPEVPLVRPPARRKSEGDARFVNDYPPEWERCLECGGAGRLGPLVPDGQMFDRRHMVAVGLAFDGSTGARYRGSGSEGCGECLGMGSLKARVRLEHGHRCLRCKHPYMPAGDALMLGVEPSGIHTCKPCEGAGTREIRDAGCPVEKPGWDYTSCGVCGATSYQESCVHTGKCPDCSGTGKVWNEWSACDERCEHRGPLQMAAYALPDGSKAEPPGAATPFVERGTVEFMAGHYVQMGYVIEAAWRILTVHHADGNKANLAWWNLWPLCQRDHLYIQHKVVLERVYPYEHSEWAKPLIAGYYAKVYLDLDLTREEVDERLDELLALERQA